MTRNRGVLSQRKIMQVMPGQHQGVDRPESCPNRSQDLVIIVWACQRTTACFTVLQQKRSLAPMLGVGSFRLYPECTRTSWQTETQQIISPLNTTQCDTAYTSSCTYELQPDRRVTQQFAVSMHDLRVYLMVNEKTTLVCLHSENKKPTIRWD